jgi:plastocyanin
MHTTAFRFLLTVLAFVGIALFASNSAQAATDSATVGQTVTFSVTVDGTAPFSYQWYKGGVSIAGATSASYVISSVQLADAGTYYAYIANSAGSTTSDDAVLTVNLSAAVPAFTTQPASQTVTTGTAVTFTAAASGSPAPTYQWRKNGTNITGATSASYTIASATTADAGTYTVVATNAAGSATSNNAVLTVNLPAVAPAFTTRPASQTVTAGTAVTFTAAASGSPAPTYQWRKNGTNIMGATSASYTIASATTADAGTYSVVATNAAGSASSNNAVLTVNLPAVAPAFTTQPASQTVTTGAAVTFTAAASGSPAPTYQWQKNGSNIIGATSASYPIASAATADAGTYSVVATNAAGSATSNNVVLTVNLPTVALSFTTQPASQTVTAGAAVTFTAAASGSPAPTFQWRKNGANITGATSASYTIASATTADAGTYAVVATNSTGSATSNNAVLTVNAASSFTTQPASQTVTTGAAVTFTAAASGSPAPTFQWRKNGSNITGATSASYTIASATTADAGIYTVVTTNATGSATSNDAVLTVITAPGGLLVTIQIK